MLTTISSTALSLHVNDGGGDGNDDDDDDDTAALELLASQSKISTKGSAPPAMAKSCELLELASTRASRSNRDISAMVRRKGSSLFCTHIHSLKSPERKRIMMMMMIIIECMCMYVC